jgi:hypothetical protein
MTTVRAIRNNNPGNLRIGEPWQGLMRRETMTAEQRAEPAFCVFADAGWGFRAMAKVILSYERIGASTVSKIIHRWAPPGENDTAAYVSAVSAALHVAPDEHIFVNDRAVMHALLKAIATHETGTWPEAWDGALEQGLTQAHIH